MRSRPRSRSRLGRQAAARPAAGGNEIREVVIADIGIPADVFDQLEGPQIELLTREQMRPLIQPRAPDAHKGDFGRVVGGTIVREGRRPCCARKARCVREWAW